jgi:ATP-dependent exoDNAse (exonuclease V) beta subunit
MNLKNYSSPSVNIRYTTMLKSKGLEWDVVILVLPVMTERKKIFQGKGQVYR